MGLPHRLDERLVRQHARIARADLVVLPVESSQCRLIVQLKIMDPDQLRYGRRRLDERPVGEALTTIENKLDTYISW